jgi:PleD family two-component response regulator
MHRKLPITFSAGVTVRKPGESRDELIMRADRALYQAKVAGKNRAVTAD